ncbi:hypothetical protein ACFPOU_04565 [Massilia jejuensis]|uniref:Uncharacterized protein n=1 Tax=Massilia jejuensis TaxID=648894 RepID=A0ABW0PEC3_9BURK
MADTFKKSASFAVPALAIAFLCAACFYAGGKFSSVTPNGKYLVADKNAVILAAVLERDSTDAQTLNAEVAQPILQVMKQYTDQGYVIVDGARDAHGNLTIAALPAGTRDITKELAAAVARKEPTK